LHLVDVVVEGLVRQKFLLWQEGLSHILFQEYFDYFPLIVVIRDVNKPLLEEQLMVFLLVSHRQHKLKMFQNPICSRIRLFGILIVVNHTFRLIFFSTKLTK
jgi:hypothetical protein